MKQCTLQQFIRAFILSYNKWYKWYNMLYGTQIKLYRVVFKTKLLQLVLFVQFQVFFMLFVVNIILQVLQASFRVPL